MPINRIVSPTRDSFGLRASCRKASSSPSICGLSLGGSMRLVGWIGIALIVGGIIIVAMRGIPYTKSRNEVEVGPLKVTAQERGLVTPGVGIAAIAVGVVLVFMGRKQSV